MLRTLLIAPILALLTACTTSGGFIMPDEALRRAQADTRLKSEARAYSQFTIARYASLTDDPKSAAENYARVALTAPNDGTVAERAIFSSLLVGNVSTAAGLAGRIPTDTLNTTELPRLALAVDALANDKTDKALGYLNQPWNSAFHAALARSIAAWIMAEDAPDAAIRLQASAGDTDPVLSGVSQTLAALMKLSTGDTGDAQADLDNLWAAHARLAIGVEANARLMALAGQPEAALARIKDFRDNVGRNPSLTALANEITTDTVAAPAPLSAKQGTALAIYAATAALSGQNESDLPSVYFALALHLNPKLDAARTLWANTLDVAGRRAEAIALLRAVPETSIYHTSAQGQLAWALRREERNDEALILAQQTLERTSDRNIRIQLADLLQSLGRDGEAEAALTDVIDADTKEGTYDWRIYFARGAARERLGRWPPAENDLKTALGLKPDSPVIMNYLGYGWIDRGLRLEDGLRLIENALRLAPNSGAITDSLGWAHYKLGNYDRAVFYLERATEITPQGADILDHLGDAYWQTGRYTEAGYQWQRALRYSDDAEESEVIQKKLSGGLALLTAASSTTP
ncbi:MAG: tetratricopeptide repeat protein [Henriciella sp.]|nr:tetratricopeptide repeat protein [Henriciella sp.]